MAIIRLYIKIHFLIAAIGWALKYAQMYVKYLHSLHVIISYGFTHGKKRDGNYTFINKNGVVLI